MSSPAKDIPSHLTWLYDAMMCSENESNNESFDSDHSLNGFGSFDDSDVDPDFKAINSSCSEESYTPRCKKQKPKHSKNKFLKSLELSSVKNNNLKSCKNKNEKTAEQKTIIVNQPENDETLSDQNVASLPTLTRKKKVNPLLWKSVIRKNLRNQGKEYQDSKLKWHSARSAVIGKCDCSSRCYTVFSEADQKNINATFWSLDATGKNHFYSKFIKKMPISRKRTTKLISRRSCTYEYRFEKDFETHLVCKQFFFKTLNISERRVYYFFKKTEEAPKPNVGIASPTLQGKHTKRKIRSDQVQGVHNHILSFPIVDSHYCRASSSKKYLEQGLNINKMYRLYREKYKSPVKHHMYSKIFNEQYNYSFFKPKKDVCDKCSEFEAKNLMSSTETVEYDNHKKFVTAAREEKQRDKHTNTSNGTTAIVSYDLQNVFNLPKANASNFFYKRKFAVYNLTGYCHINKKTYCAIWHELVKGRAGNDIASSLISILTRVVRDNPDITEIILRSDSCIPQNKNRLTSIALLDFLSKNHNISRITQKFSEPGHSTIQEIDAVHSVIDRHLKHINIYSPVSLMHQLKSFSYPNVTLDIYPMRDKDFLNYDTASKTLLFPPYNSLRCLIYNKTNLNIVQYKETYSDVSPKQIEIFKKVGKRNQKQSSAILTEQLPKIKPSVFKPQPVPQLTKEKSKDIHSMLKYMPDIDAAFYKAYLK